MCCGDISSTYFRIYEVIEIVIEDFGNRESNYWWYGYVCNCCKMVDWCL